MLKELVTTSAAPLAIGPYSQGVSFGPFIFTSGQLGIKPGTMKLGGIGVEEQTRRALANLKAILEAGGSSLANVIKTTVFLVSMDDFEKMNQVYAEFFPESPPARSTVEVSRLPKGALVEIEAVAYR